MVRFFSKIKDCTYFGYSFEEYFKICSKVGFWLGLALGGLWIRSSAALINNRVWIHIIIIPLIAFAILNFTLFLRRLFPRENKNQQ